LWKSKFVEKKSIGSEAMPPMGKKECSRPWSSLGRVREETRGGGESDLQPTQKKKPPRLVEEKDAVKQLEGENGMRKTGKKGAQVGPLLEVKSLALVKMALASHRGGGRKKKRGLCRASTKKKKTYRAHRGHGRKRTIRHL